MGKLKVPVTQHDHIRGHSTAPITLVEYGDYECPDCGRAYPMLKDLKARLGEKLTFAFRHFPLFTVRDLAEARSPLANMVGEALRQHKMEI